MRSATYVLQWEGPDKKVREFIEERLDGLFYELTMTGLCTWADGELTFVSRVKQPTQQHREVES